MNTKALSEMTLTRAKRYAIIGALTLWVACPLVLGAWITVAVYLTNRGHVGAGWYALMAVWALVCLAILVAGFAFLLGGIFFWWRSHSVGGQRRDDPRRSQARQDLLRQLREQVREERADDAPATECDEGDTEGASGAAAHRVDSEVDAPRR